MKEAHDALDRMKRARDRGTGCHLTAEMVHALSCTILGQTWGEERPPAIAAIAPDREKGA